MLKYWGKGGSTMASLLTGKTTSFNTEIIDFDTRVDLFVSPI